MKAAGIVRRSMTWAGVIPKEPPHHAHPRGRPIVDRIGAVGAVLLWNDGFSQAAGLVVVHSDEDRLRDDAYSEQQNGNREEQILFLSVAIDSIKVKSAFTCKVPIVHFFVRRLC